MKNINKRKLFITLSLVVLLLLAIYYVPLIALGWYINQSYENWFSRVCARQDIEIPPDAELLISACEDPEVLMVLGGELLLVHEYQTSENYMLNLRTGEKTQAPNDPLLLEQFINDLKTNYEFTDSSIDYADVSSPTGRYVVRDDGIYHANSDIPVITSKYMEKYFKSWYYDESSVVFSKGSYFYDYNSMKNDRLFHGSPLPYPVLKVNLPTQ